MSRKLHLRDTKFHQAACQGRANPGAEHIVVPFAEFATTPVEQRCAKCNASKLFKFLSK